MSCKFDEMLLYEYIDNILEPDEKLKVTNHLSACPHCRKKIAEIKLMFYELEHLDAVEIPEELALIRQSVVTDAFDSKQSVLQTATSNLKKTGSAVLNAPVIKHVVPSKEDLTNATKHVYSGSKKALSSLSKKEKKSKKSMKERLGGLI